MYLLTLLAVLVLGTALAMVVAFALPQMAGVGASEAVDYEPEMSLGDDHGNNGGYNGNGDDGPDIGVNGVDHDDWSARASREPRP